MFQGVKGIHGSTRGGFRATGGTRGCWCTRVGKEATERSTGNKEEYRGHKKGMGHRRVTKGGAGGMRGHMGGRGAREVYRGARAQGVIVAIWIRMTLSAK